MSEINCSYDIHYICGMALKCNGILHCICTRTLHFMGVSAWLRSTPKLGIDEWTRYHWTKSNTVALLNEMVKKKKTCVG